MLESSCAGCALSLLCVKQRDWAVRLLECSCGLYCTGSIAHCGGPDINRRCPFVRLSFATAAVEELAVGVARLGEVLKKVSDKQVHVQEEPNSRSTTATTMF